MSERSETAADGVTAPGIGDEFPDLTVETSRGEVSLPDDYEGSWLVLFSHPGDFTPV